MSKIVLVKTFVVVAIMLIPFSTSTAQESLVVVDSIEGLQVEGTLSSIEFDSVVVQTAGGPIKINFEQINAVDFAPQFAEQGILIRLLDGSELQAKTIAIESGRLKTGLACGAILNLDVRHVDWVRFQSYENELELGKQWSEMLADESREGDAIVLNRSNELDTVEGLVGDLNDDKLTFSIDDQTARVAIEKLDAILFYHAIGREFDSPICEVVLADNSKILARELGWEKAQLKLASVCGPKFDIPVGAVSKMNFRLGRDAQLSEMTPTTNDWQPLLTSSAIFERLRKMNLARVNMSFAGQPLSLKFNSEAGLSFLSSVKQFENGFAVQGGGKLAFSLNGQYEKLTGLVGFDPAASSSGNVLLRVLLDGKVVVEEVMVHEVMKNPIAIDLNIKDVNRIVFQVDYQDGRSTGDQLHLVNLKVSQ